MRQRKIRQWLGYLIVFTTLFTPTTLLWAQVGVPMHTDSHMQQHCQSHLGMTAGASSHCQHNQHDRTCAAHCLVACIGMGITLPTTMALSVSPYFHSTSWHIALNLPAVGILSARLERPPRSYT
ncbi:MAG: hypothetical protein GC149_08465 [Gammaproteobacteria bacterium]|nr:hypothetical protein [Gammaproteobacteria bacterium]